MIAFLQNWGDLIIAVAALIVAIWSLCKSNQAQKLQSKVNELELKIKEYEFDKITKEQEESSQTLIDVNVIEVGSGKYRLRVSNIGKQNVYDINVNIDGQYEIFLIKKDIVPLEILEPYKKFDLGMVTHSMSLPKFEVEITWKDEHGKKFKKKFIRTFR